MYCLCGNLLNKRICVAHNDVGYLSIQTPMATRVNASVLSATRLYVLSMQFIPFAIVCRRPDGRDYNGWLAPDKQTTVLLARHTPLPVPRFYRPIGLV